MRTLLSGAPGKKSWTDSILHYKRHGDFWPSQMTGQTEGAGLSPLDCEGMKSMGFVCSRCFLRGTSWSCYFVIGQDWDNWDTPIGNRSLRWSRRPGVPVWMWGVSHEGTLAQLREWGCDCQSGSWMIRQGDFLNISCAISSVRAIPCTRAVLFLLSFSKSILLLLANVFCIIQYLTFKKKSIFCYWKNFEKYLNY